MKKKGIPFFIIFTNIDDEDVGEGDEEGYVDEDDEEGYVGEDDEEGYTLVLHLPSSSSSPTSSSTPTYPSSSSPPTYLLHHLHQHR